MFIFDNDSAGLYSSALLFDVCNWNSFAMYDDNEMILTENNIEKAAKFIGAAGFKKVGKVVTFFKVPTDTLNITRTKSTNTYFSPELYEYVSIRVGSFIFINQ